MPRIFRPHGLALVAVAGLVAGCGGGGSVGSSGAAGLGAASGDDSAYEIRAAGCDPIRGSGTITNEAGEPAAFRVTVAYEYRSEDLPFLRSDVTPVLADGESFEFSVGPDPTRGSPASCSILGADRVEPDEADVAEVIDREAVAPDGEQSTEVVEPLWSIDGVGGSVRAVAAHDSIGYMASDLSGAGAIFAVELATGDLVWEIESNLRYEILVPDGRGGLLAASGNVLVAFDDAGNERWESVPLRRTEGAPAGSIEHVAVDGDVVIVGGKAPAAAAAVDLETGEQRWHLPADEALSSDPIGFSGAGDSVTVTDHGVLVAGGVSSLRHLALLDVSGSSPFVQWSVAGVGTNVSTDGSVVIDAVGDTVTAWDLATGHELWSITDEAWARAPAAGVPAIVGDVALVQRPGSTIAFDVATGAQIWEDTTLPAYQAVLGPGVLHDDRFFGQLSTTSYVLMAADGAVTEIDVDADITGTVPTAALDDGKVLLVARGSTVAQGSTAFVLDVASLR